MNNYYTVGEQIDYLDFERELNKLGKQSFIQDLFENASADCDLFLSKIKSLGLEINEYSTKEIINPFWKEYNDLLKRQDKGNKEKIYAHLNQVNQLNTLFLESNITINKIFEHYSSKSEHILAQFIVFLEVQLRLLRDMDAHDLTLEESLTAFDSYISSSGVILKYLFNRMKLDEQCGINRIFSENDLLWNKSFYDNYVERDNLMDAFEYWKYSKIKIVENEGKFHIDFTGRDFNRAVLVSNFRFKSYMRSIETDILNYNVGQGKIDPKDISSKTYNDIVTKELCFRFFGKKNMNRRVFGVEIEKWVDSILFLQYESIDYLEKKKKNLILSVRNVCLGRTEHDWKKRLISFSKKISEKEANIIIDKLTFCKQSKDLIDAPFIKIQDRLIILPTLTKEIRPLSAILSMFSERETQIKKGEADLSFKGTVFEERAKHLLYATSGIKANRLHVKFNKEEIFEREIDLAFIMEDCLFLIECKSFNQPYTVREHAKVNKKIRDAIAQLNKNSAFFEKNLNIVKEQLGEENSKVINLVTRILLTSNILGEAGRQENVFVTDEASFNAFFLRNAPSLNLFEGGETKKVLSFDNEGIFTGIITAQKFITSLDRQYSIAKMKKRFNRVSHNGGTVNYECFKKTVEDVYFVKVNN